MAFTAWSMWVKWNGTMEQTLASGQQQASQGASIAEARKRAGAKGTASILDVVTLDDQPHLGRCWVMDGPALYREFGSKTPPKKAVEAGHEALLENLERGQAVAVTVFARGLPSAVLFAGRTEA